MRRSGGQKYGCLLYTSQQKWKDRQTEHYDDEVHGLEAMNEKLSLSQRFGLTLTYPVPNQAQYLEIVHYPVSYTHLNNLQKQQKNSDDLNRA